MSNESSGVSQQVESVREGGGETVTKVLIPAVAAPNSPGLHSTTPASSPMSGSQPSLFAIMNHRGKQPAARQVTPSSESKGSNDSGASGGRKSDTDALINWDEMMSVCDPPLGFAPPMAESMASITVRNIMGTTRDHDPLEGRSSFGPLPVPPKKAPPVPSPASSPFPAPVRARSPQVTINAGPALTSEVARTNGNGGPHQ